ncbi:MAG: UDP-N-acetylmuramoyl-tripeptide--D-alanyl-D-alanine ligase [Treponemataceae bacterium]|nr:MAG: UDP-N-acetylmuramoyl-tripeptide--D-alanyl-D-alanine ligase [Treponemataceae bacterium]
MSEDISPNVTLLGFAAIVDAVHGKAVFGCSSHKNVSITSRFCFSSVHTDSRKVVDNSLFVPLKGEKVDGHTFIPEALKNGASCVFIENADYEQNKNGYTALGEKFPDAVFIVVESALCALQDAARAYVKQFKNIKKIAVTGSSGKTTTKEILAAIFRTALGSKNVICNEGNLNSDIGLPLSVFRINAGHTVGIFEMGMNRKGEIAELASILVPDYAIITNVGTAHIGILGSRYAIAAEKKNVFSHFTKSCKGFIPDANKCDDTEYSAFLQENVLGEIATFGDAALCGISAITDCGINGFEFLLAGNKVHFPLCGAHNFKNMLGAISIAQSFGISDEKIAQALPQVQTGFARSQIVECGGIHLIQDCYNANPDSMAAALDFTATIASRKIFVLGDMKELGSESEKAHAQIAQKALKSGASVIVFFGENFQQALNRALGEIKQDNTEILVFGTYTDSDIEEAAQKINAVLQTGDTVLLKASRSVALERIAPLLQASLVASSVASAPGVRYA